MSIATTTSLSEEAKANLPKHVAVIMDGNGRWAKQRGLPRIEGHRNGIESVRAIVEETGKLGIPYLTLYAFSLENWIRPKDEIAMLMQYLGIFLKKETPGLLKNNVRLYAIGNLKLLPKDVQTQLTQSIKELSQNTGLTLILALSYGSRQEILHAVQEIAQQVQKVAHPRRCFCC